MKIGISQIEFFDELSIYQKHFDAPSSTRATLESPLLNRPRKVGNNYIPVKRAMQIFF